MNVAALAAADVSREILARSAKGDPDAFAAIVSEHQSMVFSIAYHFLRDRAVAEELAQEVFLHLHRNLRAIQSPTHLLHWLRKVTSHRCVDQARRRKLRPRISLTEYLEHAPEPRAECRTGDPLLAGELRRLIERLPVRSRLIVILRFQEDLEPGEIAETLGIPLGTVKSNLHRSLALLRGKLERSRKGIAR
jgi:RNA polymerase sigma-70 factor (ECF subfamily)